MSGDVDLAVRAVRAGAAAALAEAREGLDVRTKESPSDLVSRADTASEAAIAGLLRAERPADGLVGEEGASAPGAGSRRWYVDGIDGTFNFVSGIPHWCVAVGLEEDGVPVAGAVYDPTADELYAAGPRHPTARNGEPATVRDGRTLEQAAVATYLGAEKTADRGETLGRLDDRAGVLRTGGAGTLELAWVAAGRVDAWAQPDVSPWDRVPGAALVRHAGGRIAVLDGSPAWHLAGPAALVDELAGIVPRR
jgi:myo-inositol-1(or 4)-monophosphatase